MGHSLGCSNVLHIYTGMGYKVLAIDYRGFADSTPLEVTESSLLEDALCSLAWLRNKVQSGDR